MIFDQVTDTQMQAARLFGGATMAGLLAAPIFRSRAPTIRVALAGVYIAGVVSVTIYLLM